MRELGSLYSLLGVPPMAARGDDDNDDDNDDRPPQDPGTAFTATKETIDNDVESRAMEIAGLA